MSSLSRLLLCVNTLLILFNLCTGSNRYIVEPGPKIIPTTGQVWPKPQDQILEGGYLSVNPLTLKFEIKYYECDILTEAIIRYKNIIKNEYKRLKKYYSKNLMQNQNLDNLGTLIIALTYPCEKLPHEDMVEEYELQVGLENNDSQLISTSIWGILRGLETFSQLIHHTKENDSLRIPKTNITDYPRFKHRGLLVDTSRHFIPLSILYDNLDTMSYNKLNVFHWHIVDDQSFPYESQVFPTLSEKGAYHPSLVYKPEDVQNIIEYARLRGIRVIPEFDTPGHTRSWGEGYPEILTQCFQNNFPNGLYGPLNPIKKITYTFLKYLYKEITETFPDNYAHLGGDEVDKSCWKSNPDIQDFMKQNNITDVNTLQTIFLQILYDIGTNLGLKLIVWEEVYTEGVNITKDVAVQIWLKPSYFDDVTKNGYNAILSSCWYLDHLKTGGDWEKFYDCDPYSYVSTEEQRKYILGGEACMWSEVVDDANILSRIWPRASATAEKLWSDESINSVSEAAPRLEEHTCRMKKRGIPAQPPNGPGFCV